MAEQETQQAISPRQPNKRKYTFTGIICILGFLGMGLLATMLGLLVYGFLSDQPGVYLVDLVVSLAGLTLLNALFRLVFKRFGMEEVLYAGNQKETAKQRLSEALTTGRETYAKVKEELRARYGHAMTGED